MQPKEYEFKTLAEIAEVVTPENVKTLAADLSNWIAFVLAVKVTEAQLPKGQTLGYDPTIMNWIDDGKNGSIITIVAPEKVFQPDGSAE